MDVEAKARAIAEEAKKTRKQVPRVAWVAALVIAAVCIVALAIGWWTSPDVPPTTPGRTATPTTMPPSFWTGLLMGLACGVTVGWMLARKRD